MDVFLEHPCFLRDPTNVGSLIPGSFVPLKPNLYIWKFLVHMLLKPTLKDSEHNLASMWNGLPWCLSGKESSCQFKRCGFDPWVVEIPWRRKWQSTPVSCLEKSHGQRSLVGYSPWGHKRVEQILATKQQQQHPILYTDTQHLLYLVICRWTFGLLLCFEYCCYEHQGACIFSNYIVFSGYVPRSGIAGSYGNSVFSCCFFFKPQDKGWTYFL